MKHLNAGVAFGDVTHLQKRVTASFSPVRCFPLLEELLSKSFTLVTAGVGFSR